MYCEIVLRVCEVYITPLFLITFAIHSSHGIHDIYNIIKLKTGYLVTQMLSITFFCLLHIQIVRMNSQAKH